MRQHVKATWLAAAMLGLAIAAPASADMLSGLKNQATESLGGGGGSTGGGLPAIGGLGNVGASLGLPSLGAGAGSNVAGVLEYCIKNKYLKATNADNVKNQLMGKLGMETPAAKQQDASYQKGLSGIISGTDGSSFDLNKIKGDVKEKACDYVLENGASLI